MKTTVSEHDFIDSFRLCDRSDNFSYEGRKALFAHMEELEDDCGVELELDPIAICCEFSEYANAYDCAKEYDYEEVLDLEPYGSVDLLEVAKLEEEQALGWLQDRTTVIEHDKGIIIVAF